METLIHLAGAVALLLWGIRTVRTGVERMFGPQIETHVAVLTGRRLAAFGLGGAAALAFQSSTAVVLMAASFASGGVLAMPAALATVLGAEVGSSLAVLILNIDIAILAPLLLFAGFVTFGASRERRGKNAGRIMLGLGFILTALGFLGTAASGLAASPEAAEIIGILSGEAIILVLATAILTWIMHSSIAVVLMIAQLVSSGGLPHDAGLWMVIGANAGAALPALVSGWALGGKGRQLVTGAAILRLIGVTLGAAMLSIPGLTALPVMDLAASHVVIAHFALNLAVALAALPFVRALTRLAAIVVPSAPAPEADRFAEQMFLAPSDVATPQTAFLNVANETSRVAHIVYDMMGGISDLFRDPEAEGRIRSLEGDVDRLHQQITLYMASIKVAELDKGERQRWFELFEFITHLEHVGDIITHNIVDLAKRKRRTGLEFSSEGATELEALTLELSDIFRHAQAVFLSRDPHRARDLVDAKRRFRAQTLQSQRRHAMRLSRGVASSVATSRIHLDLLRELQRINSHLTAVAYPLLTETPDFSPAE
ncbi:Na/Pi cotransporter family protein [Acuticoccus kandeliae]|uniref:Na/Pi cotransporter family protein n=1 Tax=Acuticoccus kandeliae TaxID=2073160 RepID=UPI00130024BB|nr:Na/Pi cotransporter family protein [Acuticoccus kandeliae]